MNALITHRGSSALWGRVGASVLLASCLVSACTNATDPEAELRLEAISETSLTGVVGEQVTPTPSVRALSRTGQPMPGVRVAFTTTGGGNVATDVGITDSDGIATAGAWTLGPLARTYTVSARSSGVAAVVFSAIARPGPVAFLQPVSGDQQRGNTGETLSQPLRVRASDAFNNSVAQVPVSFTVISGNGTIDSNVVLTDTNGYASRSWTLGMEGGVQMVRAQTGGVFIVLTAVACDAACQAVQILFESNGSFYRTSIFGHTIRLTNSFNDFNPAVSADGRRVAFQRSRADGTRDLHIMNADGSNVVLRAYDFHSPSWSPDGRQLAVARGMWCFYDCAIYVLSADDDGSNPKEIASGAARPAWSPDGTRIAFVSLSGDDGYHALHVMNTDGSDVAVISPRDAGSIDRPSWSPDGTRIAFSKCINDGCDIYVADGLAVRKLTSVGNAHDPAWSPDGTMIAIARWTFGLGDLMSSIAWVDARTGGAPVEIVPAGWTPVWLPAPPASRVRYPSSMSSVRAPLLR